MARIELEIYTPGYKPNGREVAVIETSRGTVRAELFGCEAPVTVGNFIELAAKGFYDSLKFHAKKPGSVVLGGCPTTRTMGPAQVLAAAQGAIRGMHPGTGDARYTIIDEWEDNPRNAHRLGSLCMAHKSAPNSGSCQFYFSLDEQPEFDDKYTVFGQATEGARGDRAAGHRRRHQGHRHRGSRRGGSGRGHRPGHAAPSHAPGGLGRHRGRAGRARCCQGPQSRLRRSRSSHGQAEAPKIRCRAEFGGFWSKNS